jgi:signal transduction histidine kinase
MTDFDCWLLLFLLFFRRPLARLTALATKNSNKVVTHCAADIGMMQADQMRLRQTLLNLMSNANKFTEKGTITIAAHQGQENGRDWVTVAVSDTGIGMTPEQMGLSSLALISRSGRRARAHARVTRTASCSRTREKRATQW